MHLQSSVYSSTKLLLPGGGKYAEWREAGIFPHAGGRWAGGLKIVPSLALRASANANEVRNDKVQPVHSLAPIADGRPRRH